MHGVRHSFTSQAGAAQPVLVDVDLTIADGEFLAIVGPSGCGKTTLLNILSGLTEVQTGSARVFGGAPRAGHEDIGYLFARDSLMPWRTIRENAELAMELRGWTKADRRRQAEQLLSAVGLADFADAYPAQLSQGMRQRVAIVRTMAPEPKLVLLDEPFSALDAQTKLLLQDSFSSLWQRLSSTVVLITHDLAEAVGLADRIVVMTRRPGHIKEIFPVDLPRPRSLLDLQGSDHFHAVYEGIWAALRDEVTAA